VQLRCSPEKFMTTLKTVQGSSAEDVH